jgi:hypothetical protein
MAKNQPAAALEVTGPMPLSGTLAVVAACLCLAPGWAQASGPGLPWVLFNDTALQRPALSGTDARVDMTLTGYDDCSRLWLGSITFPAAGAVTLAAEAEQGLGLYVGGRCVVDGWQPGDARSGQVTVAAGETRPLRLEYWHLGGEAYARLYWSWEGHPQELVPASAFSHSPDDAAHIQALATGKELVGVGNQGPDPGPGAGIQSAPSGDEEVCSSLYRPGQVERPAGPIPLGPGPQLLVDDFMVASSQNLTRVVVPPQRDPGLPNPVVTGEEDHNYQPYLTVLRDPATGRFRMWYGAYGENPNGSTSHLGYLESADGIHWERPARLLADPGPIQFGSSVLDEGPGYADLARRYKFAWWHDGGIKLATSPDGLAWTALRPYPVLRHNHDINNLWWDPLRGRYVATLSVYTTGAGWPGTRRVTLQSTSADLLTWERPWYILTPSPETDHPETQFYAMNGHLTRGGLWLGLVKVLRDDLRAPGTPEGAFGVGYTTLAWTRDGRHWVRDQEPYFEPDPHPGAWDHAHAWIDWQLPVGGNVLMYYGGYQSGHKMNRFEERQIGVLRIPQDRYVSRRAGAEEGLLVTPPVALSARRLTVNARVAGELRVQVTDEAGAPLPGFGFSDCAPLRGDALAHVVTWPGDLSSLGGRPVRLAFRLRETDLYAFSLE